MQTNPYSHHRDEEILSASPLELVALLYGGLQASISEARRAVRQGDIPARSAAISRAMEILRELASSLNHEQGGELAERLSMLYVYVHEQLQQAHFEQSEAPLERAETVVAPLQEAWQSLRAESQRGVYEPAGASEPVCVRG